MYANTSNGIIDYNSAQGPVDDDLNSRRPKPVFFWTNGEVMKWMKRHCEEYYELYGNVFLENEITGRSLIRINEHSLERMGIENAEHRDQISRIILKLRLKSDIIELKDLEKKAPPTQPSTTSSNATVPPTSAAVAAATLTRSITTASARPHLLSSFHR